ncbi:MAG TPA: MBL fold metallo-hydrolase [Planctomycetota bacterium]|nr:MBL fold metallo-hydrolase [Planctomycetota bacterium]
MLTTPRLAALALRLLAARAPGLDTSRTLERTVTQLAPCEWTDLPVRYVLNTHWHQDHNGGNHEYVAAFPGVQILATSETKRRMDAMAPAVAEQILADAAKSRSELGRALASGLGRDGQALDEAGRARTRQSLADVARVEDGARHWVYQAPSCTFDDALTLDAEAPCAAGQEASEVPDRAYSRVRVTRCADQASRGAPGVDAHRNRPGRALGATKGRSASSPRLSGAGCRRHDECPLSWAYAG